MKERKFIKKRDGLIVLIVLLFAVLLFGIFQTVKIRRYQQTPLYVTITSGGETLYERPLSEDFHFVFENNENVVIEIKDNKAWFVQSDCPDQLCVNQGYLAQGGDMAACLPNRIILQLTGPSEPSIDAVT